MLKGTHEVEQASQEYRECGMITPLHVNRASYPRVFDVHPRPLSRVLKRVYSCYNVEVPHDHIFALVPNFGDVSRSRILNVRVAAVHETPLW